jgi:hypothetical protein
MQPYYQPKGGMCKVCNKSTHNCSGLPFKYMTQLSRYMVNGKTHVIVRCSHFVRGEK